MGLNQKVSYQHASRQKYFPPQSEEKQGEPHDPSDKTALLGAMSYMVSCHCRGSSYCQVGTSWEDRIGLQVKHN